MQDFCCKTCHWRSGWLHWAKLAYYAKVNKLLLLIKLTTFTQVVYNMSGCFILIFQTYICLVYVFLAIRHIVSITQLNSAMNIYCVCVCHLLKSELSCLSVSVFYMSLNILIFKNLNILIFSYSLSSILL